MVSHLRALVLPGKPLSYLLNVNLACSPLFMSLNVSSPESSIVHILCQKGYKDSKLVVIVKL